MRADSLFEQVGGVGRWALENGNLEFFRPQMAFAYRLDFIALGPKNS
jgi:hypothetical protein